MCIYRTVLLIHENFSSPVEIYFAKNPTISQVESMLAISKNVVFPGHNHLTAGTVDPSLAGACAIIKVSGHQYQWLAGGYDLKIVHFRSS